MINKNINMEDLVKELISKPLKDNIPFNSYECEYLHNQISEIHELSKKLSGYIEFELGNHTCNKDAKKLAYILTKINSNCKDFKKIIEDNLDD